MTRLTAVFLLCAIGASAYPQRHGHHHHDKRAEGDLITATIDGKVVSWIQHGNYYNPSADTKAPANLSSSTPPIVKPPTTGSTSSDSHSDPHSDSHPATSSDSHSASHSASNPGSLSDVISSATVVHKYTEFCSDSSATKRATKEQIAKVGNIGTSNDYGCNWLVPATAKVAAQYRNTLTFSGATEDTTCFFWNKVGRSGGINAWYTNMKSYFTLNLPAGQTRYLAAADNTLGAITCQPARLAPVVDHSTALLYTWIEATFVDSNTGYSCVDASSIISQNAGGTVNGVKISSVDGSSTSSIGPHASSVHNAFTADMASQDGYGVQGPGPLKVLVDLGFKG